MTGTRVGGSGSTEIVQANQPQPSAAVTQAHPHAVSPSSNPPLTASQSAAQAPESSAAGAARLPVAPRHLPTLEKFRAEQPTVKGTSTPTISANAALLIGSLLQSENCPSRSWPPVCRLSVMRCNSFTAQIYSKCSDDSLSQGMCQARPRPNN